MAEDKKIPDWMLDSKEDTTKVEDSPKIPDWMLDDEPVKKKVSSEDSGTSTFVPEQDQTIFQGNEEPWNNLKKNPDDGTDPMADLEKSAKPVDPETIPEYDNMFSGDQSIPQDVFKPKEDIKFLEENRPLSPPEKREKQQKQQELFNKQSIELAKEGEKILYSDPEMEEYSDLALRQAKFNVMREGMDKYTTNTRFQEIKKLDKTISDDAIYADIFDDNIKYLNDNVWTNRESRIFKMHRNLMKYKNELKSTDDSTEKIRLAKIIANYEKSLKDESNEGADWKDMYDENGFLDKDWTEQEKRESIARVETKMSEYEKWDANSLATLFDNLMAKDRYVEEMKKRIRNEVKETPDPTKAGFSTQYSIDVYKAKEKLKKLEELHAREDLAAISHVFLLNHDPASIPKGKWNAFWKSIPSGFAATLKEYSGVDMVAHTDWQVRDQALQAILQSGGKLTKEQTEAMQKTFGEDFWYGLGYGAPGMAMLILTSMVVQGGAAASGLDKAFRLARLLQKNKALKVAYNVIYGGTKEAVTASLVLDPHFGVEMGFTIGGVNALSRYLPIQQFLRAAKGSEKSFVKAIEKAVKVIEKPGEVAVVGVGSTVAIKAGEYVQNLADAGFDIKPAFKKTFGTSGDEAIDNILMTYFTMLMYGGASAVGKMAAQRLIKSTNNRKAIEIQESVDKYVKDLENRAPVPIEAKQNFVQKITAKKYVPPLTKEIEPLRKELHKMTAKGQIKFTVEEIDHALVIGDGIAKTWAEVTGKTVEEYYEKFGVKIAKDPINDLLKLGEKAQVLKQIVGENANLSKTIKGNLDVARKMEKDGIDKKTLRIATGWERGADGKWRYEVPDIQIDDAVFDKIKNSHNPVKLKDILSKGVVKSIFSKKGGNDLLSLYPELGEVTIGVKSAFMDIFGSTQGWFNPITNEIVVTPQNKTKRSTLIHEIQHWIQTKEGFAKGGNLESAVKGLPNEIIKNIVNKLNSKFKAKVDEYKEGFAQFEKNENLTNIQIAEIDNINKLYRLSMKEERDAALLLKHSYPEINVYGHESMKKYGKEQNNLRKKMKVILTDAGIPSSIGSESPSVSFVLYGYEKGKSDIKSTISKSINNSNEIIHIIEKGNMDDMVKIVAKHIPQSEAYEYYKRLAGEVESRNTQSRLKLTEKERKEKTIEETSDVAYDENLILFQDSPGNALEQAAINNKGLTKNLNEAGYVLKDGKLLDFSGKNKDSKVKTEDHRAMELPMDKITGTDLMIGFMETSGAVRIDASKGVVHLASKPTPEQMRVIRQVMMRNKKGWYLDMENKGQKVSIASGSIDMAISKIESFFKGEMKGKEGLLHQEPKGYIDMLNKNVGLMKKSDVSTILHEFAGGHMGEMVLKDMAKSSPEFNKHLINVEKWLGVKKTGEWSKTNKEKFARGWETYIREGKSPNESLKAVFEYLKAVMQSIYKSAKELNAEINPEVRKAFDAMLKGSELKEKGKEKLSGKTSINGVEIAFADGRKADVRIEKFEVPKDKRGEGYGTDAMYDILKKADEAGISLEIKAENKDAIRFLRRNGFVVDKEGNGYRKPKMDIVKEAFAKVKSEELPNPESKEAGEIKKVEEVKGIQESYNVKKQLDALTGKTKKWKENIDDAVFFIKNTVAALKDVRFGKADSETTRLAKEKLIEARNTKLNDLKYQELTPTELARQKRVIKGEYDKAISDLYVKLKTTATGNEIKTLATAASKLTRELEKSKRERDIIESVQNKIRGAKAAFDKVKDLIQGKKAVKRMVRALKSGLENESLKEYKAKILDLESQLDKVTGLASKVTVGGKEMTFKQALQALSEPAHEVVKSLTSGELKQVKGFQKTYEAKMVDFQERVNKIVEAMERKVRNGIRNQIDKKLSSKTTKYVDNKKTGLKDFAHQDYVASFKEYKKAVENQNKKLKEGEKTPETIFEIEARLIQEYLSSAEGSLTKEKAAAALAVLSDFKQYAGNDVRKLYEFNEKLGKDIKEWSEAFKERKQKFKDEIDAIIARDNASLPEVDLSVSAKAARAAMKAGLNNSKSPVIRTIRKNLIKMKYHTRKGWLKRTQAILLSPNAMMNFMLSNIDTKETVAGTGDLATMFSELSRARGVHLKGNYQQQDYIAAKFVSLLAGIDKPTTQKNYKENRAAMRKFLMETKENAAIFLKMETRNENGEVIKTEDVPTAPGHVMRLYALSKNAKQADKLFKHYGFTQEYLKSELLKSKDGKLMVEFTDHIVNEYLKNYYDTINKVYREIYYTDMPREEFYFSVELYRDTPLEINFDKNESVVTLMGNLFNDSMRRRTKNDRKIKINEGLDFADALFTHVNNMEFFKAYAEPIRRVNPRLSNPVLQEVLKEAGWARVFNFVVRKGISMDRVNEDIGGLKKAMERLTISALALKPNMILKQGVSAVAGAAEFHSNNKILNKVWGGNTAEWIARSTELILNPVLANKITKELVYYSPKFRSRLNNFAFTDMDMITSNNSHAAFKKISNMRKAREFAMSPILVGDYLGVFYGYAPHYMAAKAKFIKEGMKPEEAKRKAALQFEELYELSQQTQTPIQKTMAQLSSGAAYKALTVFRSTQILYLNKELMAMHSMTRQILRKAKTGKGPLFYRQDLKNFIMYHSIVSAMYQGAASLPKLIYDRDTDEFMKDIGRAAALGSVNGLFITGEFIMGLTNILTGKPFWFDGIMTDPFKPLVDASKMIYSGINKGETRKIIEGAFLGGGYAFYIPTSTVVKTAKAVDSNEDLLKIYLKAMGYSNSSFSDKKSHLSERSSSSGHLPKRR